MKSPLPAQLGPQLATLAAGVPGGEAGDWIFELKFDGYRVMTRIEGGKPALLTRGGHDWSSRMPDLVGELEQLGLQSAYLDGEIVVPGPDGLPDFNALQNAFDRGRGAEKIVYYLFDIPYFEGFDLRGAALVERRRVLERLLDGRTAGRIRFSADFDADPASILRSACRMKLEGVIAKRADARYASRRTETWLKLKCKLRQEFVVCGYTLRSDDAGRIGSLLLGVYEANGNLVSTGSVGTGWNDREAKELRRTLEGLATPRAPFSTGPTAPGRWSRRAAGSERWVRPELVAEASFAGWTPDGQVRHASYIALRTDKPARAIVRERAMQISGG